MMIGSVKWICEFDLYVLIKSLVSSRPIWVQTPFTNIDHHLAIVSKKCAALSQTLTKISTRRLLYTVARSALLSLSVAFRPFSGHLVVIITIIQVLLRAVKKVYCVSAPFNRAQRVESRDASKKSKTRTCCAMLPTSGSCGFASVKREQMDSKTLEIVSAGLHCSFKMSRQI